MNAIAALAVALKQAKRPEFREYQEQVTTEFTNLCL